MKNGIFKIVLIIIASLILTGCNNDNEDIQDLKGFYSGTFTVEYLNGDTFSNSVTISFNEGNNYESSASEDYFPAGGSGTFEKRNSTIEFYDINYWTANFDWNLILEGEYDYSINGNELIISANRIELGIYKYELSKE